MKNGQIVETREVSNRGSFTFGRAPGSDFVLEHPSASRLHAVLQYRGADGQAFLYDAGSAHGTFLNKKQIAPKTHVPIRCPCAALMHAQHGSPDAYLPCFGSRSPAACFQVLAWCLSQ